MALREHGEEYDWILVAAGHPPKLEWRNVKPIPEGAMRVAPGSDAVVWKISPEHCGEL